MSRLFSRFARDEDGATAIEYAVIAVLLGVALIGSAGSITKATNSVWSKTSTELGKAK